MTDVMDELARAEGRLDEALARDEGIATRRQVKLVERKTSRAMKVTIAIVALIAVLGVTGVAYLLPRMAATASETALNSQSVKALTQARDDLIASGVPEKDIPPVLQVPADPAEVDIQAIVNATAATVLAQIRNDPAFKGSQGVPGVPGEPCDPDVNDKCVGPQGTQGEPGKQGEKGAQGDKGEKGQDGTNGKDAPTVTSASFVGDPTNCVWRVRYSDGTRTDSPVPGSFCVGG